jgi:sigma-B regulation protein RsbU (phosphoserine phosphatase)
MLELSDDLIKQVSQTVIEKTINYMSPALSLVKMSSRFIQVESVSSNDELFETSLIDVMNTYPQIFVFEFGDEDGNFIMQMRMPDEAIATKIIDRTSSPPLVTWKFRTLSGDVFRMDTSSDEQYDPRVEPWYVKAKKNNELSWTEVYLLFSDQKPGITASYPIIDRSGKFIGVAGLEIELAVLSNFLESLKVGKSGVAFIIDQKNRLIAYPDIRQTVVRERDGFRPARVDELKSNWIRESFRLGKQDDKNGSKDKFYSKVNGKNYITSFTSFPESFGMDWEIVLIIPENDFIGSIKKANWKAVLLALYFLIIAIILVWVLSRGISRPIVNLTEEIKNIKDFPLVLSSEEETTEVADLKDAFNQMGDQLKEYMENLKETTAAKERIESELKIAHDIQMGILPKIFPPFPDRHEFDIYATLEPAKEVGGDLYDFFFMDDDHFCFTVGDVSGKGVPAALFMAVTKTLIKTKATQGLTAENILTRVNEDLSLDNPSVMFVTLFLGILNIRTGELDYCNGGHNPPYLIHTNGSVEAMKTTNGMALGVMEDFQYTSKRIVLEKGTTIFMYTDGITEAMNEREELFSEERLENELIVLKDKSTQEMAVGVMERINTFSEGMPQFDDITMMMVRFYGV